ncbi:hypothetical protein HOLleu_19099 [Holothuria leucospilota]|uniref:Uncharacterized protein n=1 Tax=Holothuria leucospilota TaxID=206669 RepID=A0A9Q1H9M1_HOLLE|nr:hypothetical protein HOLleu_19099 [Holothuria leucospilota]
MAVVPRKLHLQLQLHLQVEKEEEDRAVVACALEQKTFGARVKTGHYLRFLATGNSYRSLAFRFRVAHNTIALFVPQEEGPAAHLYYRCCAEGCSAPGAEDVAAVVPTAAGVSESDSGPVEAGAGTTATVAFVVVGIAVASAPKVHTTATVEARTLAAAALVSGAYTLSPGHEPHPQTPYVLLGSSPSSLRTSCRKPACRLVDQSPTPASVGENNLVISKI